jgi:threonine dehydratase
MNIPSYTDIQQAHERIRNHVNHTPVMRSTTLDRMTNCCLWFKCENFQKTGTFKYRGATNAVLSLTEEEASRGVATHSSGNHAAALALAAKNRGIACHIAMPRTAPGNKKEAVQSYGGSITFCEPTLQSREDTVERIIESTGATFIHPYDNFQVICGQGTAAKELLEDMAGLDAVFVPVGGGGILSGSAIAAKSMVKGINVFGCEPAKADDAFRSFRSGKLVPSVNPQTIADGLLTSLSETTFSIILKYVDDIITVSEEEIIKAMRLIWERMKIIVEPSSAVALAAVMQKRERFRGIRAGIMLTGGNADLSNLPFQCKSTQV